MAPQSAFSTGQWQDEQKKQQPAAPQTSATPPVQPAVSATPTTPTPVPSPQPSRNYYGQAPPANPMSQQAQIQNTPGSSMTALPSGSGAQAAAGQSPPPQSWAPADFGFASQRQSVEPEGVTRGPGVDNESYTSNAMQIEPPSQPDFLDDPVEMPKPMSTHSEARVPQRRHYYGQ